MSRVYTILKMELWWVYTWMSLSTKPDTRRVMVATRHKLLQFAARMSRQGSDGSGPIYTKVFEGETPTVHEIDRTGATVPSSLATSPDPPATSPPSSSRQQEDRAFAWLNSQGIFNGQLLTSSSDLSLLGKHVFRESNLLPQSKLPPIQSAGGRSRAQQPPISSISLTQFHVLALVEGRLTAVNRLDESVVYSQQVLEPGKTSLGLFADHQKNTYWLFTSEDIFEIVVNDEDRDVWRILLSKGQYETAQRYAKTTEQKDAVASATGDHLISQGKFDEAATVLGRSTRAFEDVALTFIDKGEQDALKEVLVDETFELEEDFDYATDHARQLAS